MDYISNDDDIRRFFGVSPLISTSIRLTKRCNLHCHHCYAEGGEKMEVELSLDDIKSLLKQLSDLSVSEVFFTGGEPFIRKDIVEILEYADQLGFNILISSNGHYITQDIIDRIRNINFKMFQISIDGKKDVHVMNRGLNSWIDADRAIDLVVYNNISNPTIGSVLLSDSEGFEEIIDYCNEKGVNNLALMLLIEAGRARDMKGPSGMDLKKKIDMLFDRYDDCGQNIVFSSNTTLPPALVPLKMRNKELHKCFSCCSFPYILGIESNGDVAPCDGFFTHPELILGNIYDSSIEEIWNSPVLEKIRNIRYQDLKGVCSKCIFVEYCGGGCRAAAYNKYHDLTMPDPACQQLYEAGEFPSECLNE